MVRDPPRKSEQTTHWAVRFRRARWARCRSRESATCTERRLRNDRRRHGLWLHGPQRERKRVLGVSGSGDQRGTRRGGRRLREAEAVVYQPDRRKGNSPEGGVVVESRIPSLWPDCNKCATVAHSRWIMFEIIRGRMQMHKYSDVLRLVEVGQDIHGQPRYLLALPDCWSRYFFLLTRALQHSLYPFDQISSTSRQIELFVFLLVWC